MQLRYRAQLEHLAEAETDFARAITQRLHRRHRLLGQQRGNKYLGVRHVATDLDIGNADRGQAVIAHGLMHQRADFTTQLRRDAIATQLRREIRSEEHTSELQSLMRISYAVFWLKKKTTS